MVRLLTPLLLALAHAKRKGCDLSSLEVGDQCEASWSDLRDMLRPTQRSVGYAWVFRTFLKSFGSKAAAQDEMDDKIVPVTLGANRTDAYILDHHHHLAALDLSGYKSVKVTLFISCDFSSVPASQQLAQLATRGYAYLYGRPAGSPNALPTAIDPASVPATIAFRSSAVTMDDDRWRALSSFTRKVKDGLVDCDGSDKYCGRAYVRSCSPSGKGVPFFEFRWGYLYDAALADASLWANASATAAFSSAYAALVSPTPSSPVDDVDDWQAAAKILVYLARGAPAGTYELPSSMGTMAGKLPGYVAGFAPIDSDDPDCDPASCRST